jgi:hypothetical protein
MKLFFSYLVILIVILIISSCASSKPKDKNCYYSKSFNEVWCLEDMQ